MDDLAASARAAILAKLEATLAQGRPDERARLGALVWDRSPAGRVLRLL